MALQVPMPNPHCSVGKALLTIESELAKNIAVPTPCIARPAISHQSVLANPHSAEAMEQVGPKPVSGDEPPQIGVGRREQAEVRAPDLVTTDRSVFAGFEGTQELRLSTWQQLGDLVEEENPAGRPGDHAGPSAQGTRKGATFVTEQLRVHQVVGNRRAVHGDETARAASLRTNGLSHELLSRAGLASDENRESGSGEAFDPLVDRLHHLRPTDHPVKTVSRHVTSADWFRTTTTRSLSSLQVEGNGTPLRSLP